MKPTVFYIEKEPCPELHEHILKYLPRMQHWHEWQGCELIYLPLHELANVEWNSIQDYLAYQFPILHKPEFKEVLGTLQDPAHMLVNRLLAQTHLQTADGQAFLIYTDDSLSNKFEILASYIQGQGSVEQFFQAGFLRLWDYRDSVSPDSPLMLQAFPEMEALSEVDDLQVHYLRNSDIYSLGLKLDYEFAGGEPDEEVPILSEEIKAQLRHLQEVGNKSAMLDVLVYILNNLNPYLKADQASVLKMIEKHWAEYAVAPHPSRLLINQHSKLFLTDFGNLEVKMTPLPKTLFFFYLRHPEGIPFKHLSDYRKELKEIYSKITNSSNPDKIEDSIRLLIDSTKNSINENCSRVKEAFIKSLDISIAKNYMITGPRGGIKKISLDRNLVAYDLLQLQGCRG